MSRLFIQEYSLLKTARVNKDLASQSCQCAECLKVTYSLGEGNQLLRFHTGMTLELGFEGQVLVSRGGVSLAGNCSRRWGLG